MEVTYLGGIAEINADDKVVQRSLLRFLNTAELLEIDNLLIDVNNLFKRKFMCCRENCDFYIHYGQQSDNKLFGKKTETKVEWTDKCCCYGGSLEIPKELIDTIDEHLDGILEFCDEECKAQIQKRGWKKKITKELTGVGSLTKDKRCLFTTIDEHGMPLCALHAYALSRNEDVLKYKPFECFLYPLEIMEIDGKILITTIDNNGTTQGFLRWGDVHLAQGCQTKTCNGIPMYEYGRDVIERTLGKHTYDKIEKAYQVWRKHNG